MVAMGSSVFHRTDASRRPGTLDWSPKSVFPGKVKASTAGTAVWMPKKIGKRFVWMAEKAGLSTVLNITGPLIKDYTLSARAALACYLLVKALTWKTEVPRSVP